MPGHRQGLLWQRIHQVKVDIVEAGILRGLDGALGVAAGVDAAQTLQATVVETLHAKAQAVDARGAVAGKRAMFHRAGVGFQRDFRVGGKPQARAGLLQKTINRLRWEQGRRAATKEHAMHHSAPHQRQIKIQIGQQRINIGLDGQRALGRVRIEIAIRAFAYAPRQVDVKR